MALDSRERKYNFRCIKNINALTSDGLPDTREWKSKMRVRKLSGRLSENGKVTVSRLKTSRSPLNPRIATTSSSAGCSHLHHECVSWHSESAGHG